MELIAIIKRNGFELDFKSINQKNAKQEDIKEEEKYIYNKYLADPYEALYELGIQKDKYNLSASVMFLCEIGNTFIQALSKNPESEFLREKTTVEIEEKEVSRLLTQAPYMIGSEYLKQEWLLEVFLQLNKVFEKEIQQTSQTVEAYLESKNTNLHLAGRVYFHLVESKKEEYPFAFLATYTENIEAENKFKHFPLKNALTQYKNNSEKLLKLLATVTKAAQKSAFIAELLQEGEIFHPISLSEKEAYTFLTEVPLYELSGILCRIPNWWKARTNKLKLDINIGEKSTSLVGQEGLMDFNLKLAMGEESLTPEEIQQLLRESEGLALIKGKWVEVDHKKLKQVLEAYEQAQALMLQEDLSIVEAMKLQLNIDKTLSHSEDYEVNITNGQWLKEVMANLSAPERLDTIKKGESFKALLRGYQEKGVSWLYYMKQLGLGACLADDMGLGKTIQIIALLDYIRQQRKEKTLLVVPASLISNWENELVRFAPQIKYYILHASKNKPIKSEQVQDLMRDNDIFITTYSMLQKYEWLEEKNWDLLILDEAQAIKNAGTLQTKSVKKLKARFKIGMTGTPIENRLSDLWSLFDFLNTGLLGTSKEFGDFIKQLKDKPIYNARLRQVVSPFILRRLKTDKTIISDLPDKIEMKTFSNLTKKQATLYTALLKELKIKLNTSEGIERKGLILGSIIKFKQICNHPDQYLGQNIFKEAESGKYTRLREICETIYEKRERVLIFTQFKEMTKPLSDFLETVFEHKGLVLHGGTPVGKRQQLVEQFQGEEYIPFMVLSIKAGGVGLNLTAANHVIHFDRWWNPAVENQATDRAFRIGQDKNVLVHKFITQGTIEEKIDKLIEEKTKLSNDIIADTKENWITEMDNEKLLALFTLSI